jgi:hypothetical protein
MAESISQDNCTQPPDPPAPLFIAGFCSERAALAGRWDPVDMTRSGRWWYRNAIGGSSLYWDEDCSGAGSTAKWIFDIEEPSTMALKDLDGDGKCSYFGGLISDALEPPSSTWSLWCGTEHVDYYVSVSSTSVCLPGSGPVINSIPIRHKPSPNL